MANLMDAFSVEVAKIELSSTAKNKYDNFEEWLGTELELGPEFVVAKYLSGGGIGQRFGELPNKKPSARLGVLLTSEKLKDKVTEEARVFLAKGHSNFEVLVIGTGTNDNYKPAAVEMLDGASLENVVRAAFADASFGLVPLNASDVRTGSAPIAMIPATMIVDPRVRRMIRLAVASSPGVLLVGPPGTGKTTLLKEVIDEIRSEPNKFGFGSPPNLPKWVTPEESWTTRELVGGETIDDQSRLRFRPGHILEAIRNDQWLVLDEANRADMDKIFGGLMTWLADQTVELGRASTALGAPVISLGWTSAPNCETHNLQELEAQDHKEERVEFLAGSEWRLLGTYNALDAQRVFRFGQALGRRFVRVPVPAISVEEFRQAIRPQLKGLPASVEKALVGLYEAHCESSATVLGPAIFMRAEAYIRSGLELPELATLATQPDGEVDEGLIAEAYLTSAGTWLAKLEEEELEALGSRIKTAGVLSGNEWEWIVRLLPALG